MTLELKLYDQKMLGRKEGIEEGQLQAVCKLLDAGYITDDIAAQTLNMSKKELMHIRKQSVSLKK